MKIEIKGSGKSQKVVNVDNFLKSEMEFVLKNIKKLNKNNIMKIILFTALTIITIIAIIGIARN